VTEEVWRLCESVVCNHTLDGNGIRGLVVSGLKYTGKF
jgi:hypothetical protein